MTTRKRHLAALIATTALLGAPVSMGLTSAPAFAETTANYDAAHAVSLTLHKFAVAQDFESTGPNAGGEALDSNPAGATPVEGVEFTVKRLKGSTEKIKTSEGMKELLTVANGVKDDPSTAGSVETEGDPVVKKTGADGSVKVDGLDQGAYLVQETSVADAKFDEGTLVPGAPFVVFLPTTSADGSAFNYDVNAYPKNTSLPVQKKFANLSTDLQSGHDLEYALSLGIPKVAKAGGQLTKYVIDDNIPAQVEFKDITLVLGKQASYEGLNSGSIASAGTALTKDADYTVDSTAPLKVTFTEAGLQKLSAAQAADDRVLAVINTEIKAALPDGTVQNTVQLTFNNGNGNGDTTTDGDTPKGPTFAKLKLHKTEDGKDNVNLEGAKFELHWCDASTGDVSTAKADAIESLITDKDHTDATKGTVAVTGQDGMATFEGLQKLTTDDTKYCLVETQAPAGYAKMKKPFLVENFKEASAGSFANNSYNLDVPNVKNPDSNLPGTGGEGKFLPWVALLVALTAGGALVVRMKKANSEANAEA